MFKRILRAAVIGAILLPAASLAQGLEWRRYVDPTYDFSAAVPTGLFEPLADAGPGLTFVEAGGGQLSLYGGPAGGLTLDGFAERLAAGEQVRRITYRAGGESWFVLSGHYDQRAGGEPLIFYTKVLLSADRQTFSAFEISYPRADKTRFDPIVEQIEDSFTRPGG